MRMTRKNNISGWRDGDGESSHSFSAFNFFLHFNTFLHVPQVAVLLSAQLLTVSEAERIERIENKLENRKSDCAAAITQERGQAMS